MNTNHSETVTGEIQQATPRAGFFTNIMPVLGKDGETVYLFLPGEMTVTEHKNRFLGLMGIAFEPKTPSAEKVPYRPRYGFSAKNRIGKSADGEWITVYLPGNLGTIRNHRNAYLHAFGLPYEKKQQQLRRRGAA